MSENISKIKKKEEKFIKCIQIKYKHIDCSQINYINDNIPILVRCMKTSDLKSIHGWYMITPKSLLIKKNAGCKKCTYLEMKMKKIAKLTKNYVLEKLIENIDHKNLQSIVFDNEQIIQNNKNIKIEEIMTNETKEITRGKITINELLC